MPIWGNFLRLVFLAFTVLLSFHVYGTETFNKTIVVIDAGSTGTRVHVYDYTKNATKDFNITQRYSYKITPGLGQIFSSKASVDAYLDLLMKSVPRSNISSVYFYATAGMRILPVKVQNSYYSYVKQWFSSNYQTSYQEVKTISGADEGIYDWLSVNHQLGLLTNNNVSQVGVMDLGGTSVQIVFPTNKKNANVTINALDKTWYLNSHSFLGLGQTQVKQQLIEHRSCYSQKYPLLNGEYADGNSQECIRALNALVNEVHQVRPIMKRSFSGVLPKRWYVMGSITYTANAEVLQYDSQHLTARSLLDTANASVCMQNWDWLSSQYPQDKQLDSYCLYSSYYYALIANGFGVDENQTLEQLDDNALSDWTIGVAILKAQQERQDAIKI